MTSKITNLRILMTTAAVIGLLATSASANNFTIEDRKPETPKAQDKAEKENGNGEEEKESSEDKKDKPKKPKTIEDKVKDMDAVEGLFPSYRDPKTGTLYLEVSADQLGKEFIYTSHTEDGVVWSGHFRGQYRQNRVFTVKKHFDRLEFIQLNPSFYFAPDNPLAKAASANISSSVISATKIEAKTEATDEEDSNRYLIKANDLFLTEAFDQVKPSRNPNSKPGQNFSLGKLSKAKSKITKVSNYPANTAVEVEYVYNNPAPLNRGGAEVTDARNVSVKVRHTLLEMPENSFKPRFDDARVGYFLDYVTDLTSHDVTPYRDMINRWHLEKKDPDAAISEPVEPIVWWIENTTPHDLRPIIKEAVLAWNIAFEKAGFKNAIVVNEQPDDADWDAGDVRYNVLRWTSSPTPPFGGYGPSFTNPRTGQILGADIMLEYSFLTNRMTSGRIFEKGALSLGNEANQALTEAWHDHEKFCSVGSFLQMNNMVGKTLNAAFSDRGGYDDKLVKEALYYLLLHEVGHTLGLNHNMKATQARSYDTAHDISAQSKGLVGSVMDYPAINYAKKGAEQAHYYTIQPGPYDIWAIQFGYSPDLQDEQVRHSHLSRSTEPGHEFGNDADDMRSPGKGIDPRVNIYDFSDDAVQYASDRLELDRDALTKIQDKLTTDGDSYQELRNAYLILTGDMAWQGRVISRYVGGVMVDRSVKGQNGSSLPYEPIDGDKQRQAMEALETYIFAPDAFEIDHKLASHLAIQRRGFAHFSTTEDPKLHGRALTIQADILSHILHPNTLARITDSGLYGNDYTVTEVLGDLTSAIFDADSRDSVNTMRQGLQLHYTKQLIAIIGGGYDPVAQSNALANLRKIRRNMERWRGDATTRAHRDHVRFLIDKALEVNRS